MPFIDKKTLEPIQLSDKVVVSDPCYKRDVWCMGFLDNVLPGNYIPTIKYSDEDDWGIRVKMLMVEHVGGKNVGKWEKQKFTVGVDSGQAGIFCDTIYPHGSTGKWGDKGTFYDTCCNATTSDGHPHENWERLKRDIEYAKMMIALPGGENNIFNKHKASMELPPEPPLPDDGGIVFGKGVVTHSGYGDGSYDCYVRRNDDGKITAIKIKYI